MLDAGVTSVVSEIGHAENFSKSYVSRILQLALLPDVIGAILASERTDRDVALDQPGGMLLHL